MQRSSPRKECPKCKQLLSYSAFKRHQDPLICQAPPRAASVLLQSQSSGRIKPTVLDANPSDDSRHHQDSDNELHTTNELVGPLDMFAAASLESQSDDNLSERESSTDDDGVEIVNDESAINLDVFPESHHCDEPSTRTYSEIVMFVSFFVSFFQVCYKLSDCAVTLLLVYLRGLLSWISIIIPPPGKLILETIVSGIPRNVYFLKKHFACGNTIRSYIVCPRCCHLYAKEQFRNATYDIPKCTEPVSRNKKCDALLFKKVKYHTEYKLVPRKTYAYHPIKDILAKLYGRKSFQQNCEIWRQRQAVSNVYTDVYDGAVWKEFLAVDGKPFLSAPYNLSLKLNVDWIQPYDRTHYSMGIIYLAVENLPRSERFKVENILLVGCIPGPAEPKLNINSFLSPLVDELMEL